MRTLTQNEIILIDGAMQQIPGVYTDFLLRAAFGAVMGWAATKKIPGAIIGAMLVPLNCYLVAE